MLASFHSFGQHNTFFCDYGWYSLYVYFNNSIHHAQYELLSVHLLRVETLQPKQQQLRDLHLKAFSMTSQSFHFSYETRKRVPQHKAVTVAPLNFVIRGLTTSCDENNCPHNTIETTGGGVRKNHHPSSFKGHPFCQPLPRFSSPVCQPKLHPLPLAKSFLGQCQR